jgi:predicted acylesterase/phospholipase RssA
VQFYHLRGREIFPPAYAGCYRWCTTQIRFKRYRTHFEGGIREDRYLSDLGRQGRNVAVTAYDTEKREGYEFKSWIACGDSRHDFKVWEAARATSAAPTYFPPAKMKSRSGPVTRSFIDGGVYANNPGVHAYRIARDFVEDAGKDRRGDRIFLVSLGTGSPNVPTDGKNLHGGDRPSGPRS